MSTHCTWWTYTLPGILMWSLTYIGHRTKSVKYCILHSPIYSTCHRVISCSSSSSVYIPDSNRMTLTSSRAHPKVSRTSGSGNFWEEWTFSGKKKKHFQHVKTTTRRQEAARFMGNVTFWKIQTQFGAHVNLGASCCPTPATH